MEINAVPPLHKCDLPQHISKTYLGKGGDISNLPKQTNGTFRSPGKQKFQRRGK